MRRVLNASEKKEALMLWNFNCRICTSNDGVGVGNGLACMANDYGFFSSKLREQSFQCSMVIRRICNCS
jgi:hypothetical protein